MTYDQFISGVVKGVEALGAAIMIVGGLWALVNFAIETTRPTDRAAAYPRLRERLGRAILLGLEILIVGDIVRTIVVDPTLESVAGLGTIVVIRIVLSFSLEVEIDGVWPWSRWRLDRAESGPKLEAPDASGGAGTRPDPAPPSDRVGHPSNLT